MTKTFRCADAGLPCGANITGESEDEVVEKAVAHARDKHGVDITQAQTLVRFAQSAIHDDAAGKR